MRSTLFAAAMLILSPSLGGDRIAETPPMGQFRVVVPELASNDGAVGIYVHDESTYSTQSATGAMMSG